MIMFAVVLWCNRYPHQLTEVPVNMLNADHVNKLTLQPSNEGHGLSW
jgi:hypothetical protein